MLISFVYNSIIPAKNNKKSNLIKTFVMHPSALLEVLIRWVEVERDKHEIN